MLNSSRVPHPSIALVLTTDHARIPRRPSVIKVAPPVPVIKIHPPEGKSVNRNDLDKVEGFLTAENLLPECHIHPALSDEAEEHMDLAESICESPILDQQERFVVVQSIKERISNALFSARQLLCVDLSHICFPGATRQ